MAEPGHGHKLLEMICWFLVVFTGFMFWRSPVKTDAQLIFRVVCLVVGAAGWLFLRARAKRLAAQ